MPEAADGGGRHPAVASRPHRRRRRRRLAYLAFRGGEALAAHLPHAVCAVTAEAVASTALRVAPRRFDGLARNLRVVLPEADQATMRRLVRANVRNLARSWLDVMELRVRADQLAAGLRIVGLHNLEEAQRRGRGVVIVSLHLGRWEVGLAVWNDRLGRMSLLAERLEPPELFERMLGSRGSMGVDVIPIDTAAIRDADAATARRLATAAVRAVMRTLRRGGMVAVAMDRDLIGNGRVLDFFGAPARIPVGAVELAIRAGAAVVPVVLLRSGEGVVAPVWPAIPYDAAGDRDAEVTRVARELLRIFEGVIREHPDQWHVLDPLWERAA